ncbi:MAG TPA: hypothetical protein VM013_06215 [Dehalococcoidia bacterium]|nr:hypothetical protein [Dehalococcoidia bacterium]
MIETGVSYFSARTLRHVRADLEDMVAHNCTFVVHCFTETDLLYYRGSMKETVEATHQAGLKAWLDPWGIAGIFSGETLTDFPLTHLDTLQERSDRKKAPAACPNNPETRRFLIDWIGRAAETGGDGVMWDEPHFFVPFLRGERSTAWACRCPICRERFHERSGHAMPERLDEEVLAFRESSLLELLTELVAEAKRLGLSNALCLAPSHFADAGFPEMSQGLARLVGGADALADPFLQFGMKDWDAAAAIPGLDVFGTDPYWFMAAVEPDAFLRVFAGKALAAARGHGLKAQIWVQAFRVPEGREEELRTGLRTAAALGADQVAAWSYDATSSMSQLRPARPDVVWRIIGEAYGELRAVAEMG